MGGRDHTRRVRDLSSKRERVTDKKEKRKNESIREENNIVKNIVMCTVVLDDSKM